jgi:branched-chain amino acid transport system ATP-binding protein
VSGLLQADSGQIIFENNDVTQQRSYDRIKAGIARSFQLVNLFDHLSCVDNVALSIFSREGKTQNLAALASRDRPVWDEAHELLRQFGLDRRSAMVAGSISHGERKLLDVAVAYALRPKLLFLDEPTSGVSTREKAPIMDIVSSIVRSGGVTVVIIEHDMDIVFRYSERIVVMHQGTVLADGSPDEIRANDAVTTTLIGTHPAGEPAFGSSGNA